MKNNCIRMVKARKASASQDRDRVLTSINFLSRCGENLSVAAVARHAGVSRSYMYRPEIQAVISKAREESIGQNILTLSEHCAELELKLANLQRRCDRLEYKNKMLQTELALTQKKLQR